MTAFADLILANGNIVTLDSVNTQATSVAVRQGRVALVGAQEDTLILKDAHTEVVDLRGRTVVPGFVDSHVHLYLTALMSASADVAGARSAAEICRRMAEESRKTPGGDWVLGFGCPAASALAEGRLLTATELEYAVPGRPAYVSSSTLHSGIANTSGLRELGFPVGLEGMEVDHDSGEPTGAFVLDDAHIAACRVAFGSLHPSKMATLIRRAADAAVQKGVTSLHCLEGQYVAQDADVDVVLRISDELPLHVVLLYQTMDVERVQSLGLERIGGCLCVDGATFTRTALFHEPYTCDSGTCGHLNISESRLREFVHQAHRAGLQIALHAIGDRAIDIAVEAYRHALVACPRADHRHRIEHFEVPTQRAVEQVAELGIACSMQPAFSYFSDEQGSSAYEHYLGPERAARLEPYPLLAKLGVVTAGGSDSPVTSIDPLLGVHALVNNPRPARRMTVDYALRMFTVNGSWLAREESERGCISPGRKADLVVLDADLNESPAEIKDIPIAGTISDGRIVYAGRL
jgi:predicted amidohydrolase YtcJ